MSAFSHLLTNISRYQEEEEDEFDSYDSEDYDRQRGFLKVDMIWLIRACARAPMTSHLQTKVMFSRAHTSLQSSSKWFTARVAGVWWRHARAESGRVLKIVETPPTSFFWFFVDFTPFFATDKTFWHFHDEEEYSLNKRKVLSQLHGSFSHRDACRMRRHQQTECGLLSRQ